MIGLIKHTEAYAGMNQNDFSRGSILKHILRIAVPMTAAQLITMLYNVIDRVFIGRIGGTETTDALTGVGICMPVVSIVMAFANLVGAGAAPLISIERGRKNAHEAEKLLGTAVSLLLIFSAAITAAGLIFKAPVLRMLGASNATFKYADTYMTIYLAGSVFPILTLGLNSIINAQGYGKIGMLTITIGAVLNIALDPILIFGLNMGVSGAAAATVISQFVSALWAIWFMTFGKSEYKIRLHNLLKLKFKRIKKITALGLAGFTMLATNAAVQAVCNITLKTYGSDIYIGVMTIINSVRDIISLPVQGFSQGTQPVLGYNYGAGNNARVKSGIRSMSVIMIIYTCIAWLAVSIFPRFFIGIFTENADLFAHGVPAMHIYFFGFVFMALQFSGQTTFTALDKPKQAVFFSLLRKIVIVVPLTLFLPKIWNPPINGVFWAEPISNIIGGTAAFVTMIFTVYRKLD